MFVPARSDAGDSIECMLAIDADRAKTVQLVSGGNATSLSVARGLHRYPFTLAGDSFDLINNVGSVLVSGDYGADRGWLEPDLGQYEVAEDVFAWCGGAVLLRSSYLRDTGVFDDRLFLYYEDLELSWRGRRRGWRYRYVPDSVVRHAHVGDRAAGLAAGAVLQRAEPVARPGQARRAAALRVSGVSVHPLHGRVWQARGARTGVARRTSTARHRLDPPAGPGWIRVGVAGSAPRPTPHK